MLYICAERGMALERDPLITQAETAGAAQTPVIPKLGKRAGWSGSADPKPPATVLIPDPTPQPVALPPWLWGPPPTSMAAPISATVQVPLPSPKGHLTAQSTTTVAAPLHPIHSPKQP